MMKSMMDLLSGGKLSLENCIFLMVTLLPSMVSYALPFGFVTATLLTLGEMSANREFIALKSSGIGPLKIFSSILFLAGCGTLLSLMVNFHYAPLAISRVKTKIQNIIREEPLRFVTPQQFIRDFPGYIIFVQSLDHGQLNDFHLWKIDDQEKVDSYIHAKCGTLSYDEQKQALTLTLSEGTAEKALSEGKDAPLVSFRELSYDLSMENIFKSMQTRKKIRHMTLSEMLVLRRQSIREGDFRKQMELTVNIQTQCAMAFSILVLVLLALPLAVKWNRRGTSLNVAIALLICIIYYFLMMILSSLAERPRLHPELIVWLPNILLQTLGIGMCWKLCRH
jgi:lipopolysaccharide export system permease protein